MGLFDSIQDALTTDPAEKYEAARKHLDKVTAQFDKVRAEVGTSADPASRERLAKAEGAVSEARAQADKLAAAAGVNTPDPAADTAAAEARAKADAQAEADAEAIRRVEEMKARRTEEKAAEAAAAAPQEAAPEAAPEEAPAAEAVAEEAAPEQAAAEPELRTHTVEKGDTLSEIGQKYGVKWRDIASLNDIANPDRIYPGQVFRIPNA